MTRILAAAGLTLMLLFGCTLNSQEPVYFVMFEEDPGIFDDGVYFRGERIGEIVSRRSGNTLAHKVTISVPDRFQDLIQTRTVFYVSSGRLRYAALAAFGDPLALGSPIRGFSSRAALVAFRLTHLMQPLPAAAAESAARLLETTG